MQSEITCDCGRVIAPNDVNSLRFGECFKCRVRSFVGFRFEGGGGYGREAFHDSTNAEFLRENDGPGTIPARR